MKIKDYIARHSKKTIEFLLENYKESDFRDIMIEEVIELTPYIEKGIPNLEIPREKLVETSLAELFRYIEINF